MGRDVEGINPNAVCTTGRRIEVGGVYDYKENMPTFVAKVRVKDDKSNEGRTVLELEILRTSDGDRECVGDTFVFSLEKGSFYYNGMGRFYDPGTYIPVE